MSNSHPHARVANGMDIARPDLTFFEVARRSSRSAVEHRIRLLVRLGIKQDSRVLRSSTPRGFFNPRPSRHLPRLAGFRTRFSVASVSSLCVVADEIQAPGASTHPSWDLAIESSFAALCGLGQTRFFAASVSSLHIVADEIKASGLTHRAPRVSRSSQLVSPQSLRQCQDPVCLRHLFRLPALLRTRSRP
jgi:hypothetical protein